MKRLRRRPIDGSARKGADETGSEQDREDAKILDCVVYGDAFVTRTEGVLHERTEVVWQWHAVGRCADAGDGYEEQLWVSTRGALAMGLESGNGPIIRIWRVSASVPSHLIGSIQLLH